MTERNNLAAANAAAQLRNADKNAVCIFIGDSYKGKAV